MSRRKPAAGYARSRAKADEIRAQLEPLRPGERPRAVTVACAAALALAVAVLAGTFTSRHLAERGGSIGGGLVIAALLLVVAGAMWRARYWGVLAFEAFLGLEILFATLALLRASSWSGLVLCVAVIGLSSWLFWKLIRAMARLQMPRRPVP